MRSLVAQQPRADEHVHVLVDEAADPDHQVVVDAKPQLLGARGGEILDDAAGSRCGADGLLLDAGLHLRGDVVARDEHQRHDRDEDSRDESEEQLSIEARPQLSQQRRAAKLATAEHLEDGVRQ